MAKTNGTTKWSANLVFSSVGNSPECSITLSFDPELDDDVLEELGYTPECINKVVDVVEYIRNSLGLSDESDDEEEDGFVFIPESYSDNEE